MRIFDANFRAIGKNIVYLKFERIPGEAGHLQCFRPQNIPALRAAVSIRCTKCARGGRSRQRPIYHDGHFARNPGTNRRPYPPGACRPLAFVKRPLTPSAADNGERVCNIGRAWERGPGRADRGLCRNTGAPVGAPRCADCGATSRFHRDAHPGSIVALASVPIYLFIRGAPIR